MAPFKPLAPAVLGSILVSLGSVASSPIDNASSPQCLADCLDGISVPQLCSAPSLFSTAIDCLVEACRADADLAHAVAALDTRCADHDLKRRQSKLDWRQAQEDSRSGGYSSAVEARRKEEDRTNLYLSMVLFGVIFLTILIGLFQHLAIQFDNFRLRKRLISSRRPASRSPRIFKKVRSWIRGRLLLPAAFGWRHLTPFLGLGTVPTRFTLILVALYLVLNLAFSVINLRGWRNHGQFSFPFVSHRSLLGIY